MNEPTVVWLETRMTKREAEARARAADAELWDGTISKQFGKGKKK